MGADFRVLGVGAPIVDLLINVDDAFLSTIKGGKGGMELVSHEEQDSIIAQSGCTPSKVPGGSAGNTTIGLANLGVPTSFLGKIGHDADGDFYVKRLLALGGEMRNFRYSTGVYTGRCLSMITPDSERTMRTDLGAAATITPEDVTPEVFHGITHVHIEGYALFAEAYFRRVVELAKQAGCIISLDLASFEVVKFKKEILPELLDKFIDIVFANEDEAAAFCGSDTPEKQALELNKYCRYAAVKLGKEGCCLAHNDKTCRVSTTPVKAMDTTGAGDLWQSGFLYGLLQNKPLEDCGKYGSILGAEVVQVIGAEIPESRWKIIKKQLNE